MLKNARRSVAIVTTTIHMPKLLRGYCENASSFGHKEVFFVIAGDHKTPAGISDFCRELTREYKYEVQYLDVPAQDSWLKSFPKLGTHLPYNSMSRRNVALLTAYQQGADIIITIDDDNYSLPDQDFVGWHSIVGQEINYTAIKSSTGWYNVCELLVEKQNLPFYHRGFPLNKRWQENKVSATAVKGKIAVNAGLWLESPDIDALTWLDLPIEAIKYGDQYPSGVGLAPGTWSPFNSQNTAIAREVLPAYFLSPYVGRYDDVWASYIVKRIADQLGEALHFGRPLVRQKRNPHNYFVDFDKERLGMELTPAFVEWLQGVALSGDNYGDCFGEIARALPDNLENIFAGADEADKPALQKFSAGLLIWQEVHATQKVPA